MKGRGVVAAGRSGGDAVRWRAGERRGASGGVSSAIRLRPAAVAAYLFGSRHPSGAHGRTVEGWPHGGSLATESERHGSRFLFD